MCGEQLMRRFVVHRRFRRQSRIFKAVDDAIVRVVHAVAESQNLSLVPPLEPRQVFVARPEKTNFKRFFQGAFRDGRTCEQFLKLIGAVEERRESLLKELVKLFQCGGQFDAAFQAVIRPQEIMFRPNLPGLAEVLP